jgi:hypothetical protein
MKPKSSVNETRLVLPWINGNRCLGMIVKRRRRKAWPAGNKVFTNSKRYCIKTVLCHAISAALQWSRFCKQFVFILQIEQIALAVLNSCFHVIIAMYKQRRRRFSYE